VDPRLQPPPAPRVPCLPRAYLRQAGQARGRSAGPKPTSPSARRPLASLASAFSQRFRPLTEFITHHPQIPPLEAFRSRLTHREASTSGHGKAQPQLMPGPFLLLGASAQAAWPVFADLSAAAEERRLSNGSRTKFAWTRSGNRISKKHFAHATKPNLVALGLVYVSRHFAKQHSGK
jgi:hypothetical protein